MSFQINDKVVCIDDRQTSEFGFTSADYVFAKGMVVEGEIYTVCGIVDNSHFGNSMGILITGKPMHGRSKDQRCPGWNPKRFRLLHSAVKSQDVCVKGQIA
jgi:hypothetical protein